MNTSSQIQPVNLGQGATDFAEQSGDKSSAVIPDAHCWMPIESAPKSYKPILAYNVEHGYEAKVYHNGAEWECVSFQGYGMGIGFYPTHWFPLPYPPVTEASK